MEEDGDNSLLSEHQRRVLINFQEITQITDEYLSIQVLQQHQWNLERSVAAMMHGDEAHGDSEEEEEYAPLEQMMAAQQQREARNASASSSSSSSSHSGVGSSSLRREVTALGTQAAPTGSLLDLLFVPLRWLFQARPTSLNPNQDAQNFIEEFRSSYGSNIPDFHNGSYQSAVATAFSQTKFVLVYLHSPMHEDADRFCQQVLSSPEFLQVANESCVVWGGKVWDPEAYGLSTQLGAAAFPFLALLVPQSARVVQIADRAQGFTEKAPLLERLRNAMGVFSAVVQRARDEQRRREESARLREQQNREYQESMEAERRENERRRREEEERIAAEELRQQQEEEAAAIELSRKLSHEDAIRKLRAAFVADPEPKAGGGDVSTVRFQLPRAKKLTRNFYKHETVQKLHDYVTLHFADEGDLTTHFAMFIPHPRTEISDMSQTVEESVRAYFYSYFSKFSYLAI